MAEYIEKAIAGVEKLINARVPDLLASQVPARKMFAHVGRSFRGQLMAGCEAWVEPGSTAFNDEGQTIDQAHYVRVTMGLTGSDPEALRAAELAYVRAVLTAVQKYEYTDLGRGINRVFVAAVRYGGMLVNQGFAVYPEIDVLVETEEVE